VLITQTSFLGFSKNYPVKGSEEGPIASKD